MKAINVLLALVVSLAVAAGVLEAGLRLLGMGPQATINRFDKDLGWVKTPSSSAHRKTGEYDVTFTINSLGIRGDEMATAAKPAGTYRVMMLGDSFVQGYTVERENVLNAFAGVSTMGSPFRLNDVFMITGTPVSSPNRSIIPW